MSALALPDIRIHFKTIIMKSEASVRRGRAIKWNRETGDILEFIWLVYGKDLKSVRKGFSKHN